MTYEEYQKQCMALNRAHDLIHNVLGLVGEAGEVSEVIKKRWYKAQCRTSEELQLKLDSSDCEKLYEELGDVEFYLACLYDLLDLDPNEVRENNIKKLTERHG